MTDIAKRVLVKFYSPTIGNFAEEYDTTVLSSVIAWKANNRLTPCMQLSVKVLETIPDTEENRKIIEDIVKEANIQVKKLRSGE
jgi:hypothetical protein